MARVDGPFPVHAARGDHAHRGGGFGEDARLDDACASAAQADFGFRVPPVT
jgi:hypothetical protein